MRAVPPIGTAPYFASRATHFSRPYRTNGTRSSAVVDRLARLCSAEELGQRPGERAVGGAESARTGPEVIGMTAGSETVGLDHGRGLGETVRERGRFVGVTSKGDRFP